MTILTDAQKQFLTKQKLKVGGHYLLPRWGFLAFPAPNYGSGGYINNNPITKSLDHQPVSVLQFSGDFVEVEFVKRGKKNVKFWMLKSALESRWLSITLILGVILIIPFILYNLSVRMRAAI